jgi:hypothetical protein
MKRSILSLVAAATLLIGSTAFAEPGVVDSTSSSTTSNIKTVKHGEAPEIVVSQSTLGVNTDVYEKQQDVTTNALNTAAVEMGNLLTMGFTAKSQASTINQMERLAPTIENVVLNATQYFDRLAAIAPKYKGAAAEMNDRLNQVYAYNFGPVRVAAVDITQVSNEGKGTVKVGDREVRYFTAPGLTATKQNEREVVAIERLADGEYKVALGIFYAGQEMVKLSWDPRTYTRVDYYLDYHNVNKDGQAWLTCGKSTCVAFSENKTVNTK